MFDFLMPKVPKVSPDDVKKAMDSANKFVILDVRTPAEITRGKIKGAISVPLDEIETKIEKAIPDKDVTVYVYCLSGSRSPFAVAMMQKKGYTHVYDIQPALLAWRAKGFPVE